jgi:hypothetical protein
MARHHPGLPMHSYAIGADSANITVTPSPLRSTALSPVFVVQRCAFTNFTSLLMPTALTVTSIASPSMLLELGCNLWNGGALAPDAIGLNASTAQRFVSYPSGSIYNGGQKCRGFFSDSVTTSYIIHVPPLPVTSPPPPPLFGMPVAGVAASIVGAASIVSVGPLVRAGFILRLTRPPSNQPRTAELVL